MARISEKAKGTLRDAAIILIGLLLAYGVLLILCTAAIGGPVALVALIMGMMGPPY